jgi:hypothetical protein
LARTWSHKGSYPMEKYRASAKDIMAKHNHVL